MGENVRQGSSVYHILLCATETSQLCCKGIKARPDVFWDLNITLKILPLIEKKSVNHNVLSLNLKLFRTKVDIKSVIRDYLLRTLLMSNLLKHANYLNAVLKSLKTQYS